MDMDGPLAWRERGRGAPVVFLHGLGGSRTSWEPQLAGLSAGFRCIAWDMPGYGASAPIQPLTFAGIADAVARLLDKAGVDRAHLVGESFGGMPSAPTAPTPTPGAALAWLRWTQDSPRPTSPQMS